MSIRQRVPFKFGEDGDAIDEQGHILDEQEQEEVIQRLKDKSNTRNTQYSILLQVVIALSAILHIVYLFNPSKQSPLATVFPAPHSGTASRQFPLVTFFTLMHMFLHVDLSMHLFSPSNPIRTQIAEMTANQIPGSYTPLFALSSIAPLVALFLRLRWLDVAWWSVALLLTWFIHSGQAWIRDEEEALQKLEALRYNAQGA